MKGYSQEREMNCTVPGVFWLFCALTETGFLDNREDIGKRRFRMDNDSISIIGKNRVV